MNTGFQFSSKNFNITTTNEYFINPENYGDDLARWMCDGLRDAGLEVSSQPSQEDFGWYFKFIIRNVDHCVVVGFQPNDVESGDCWIGWIERDVGLLKSIFGGRHQGVLDEAVEAIDSVLRTSTEIRDLKWVPQDMVGTT